MEALQIAEHSHVEGHGGISSSRDQEVKAKALMTASGKASVDLPSYFLRSTSASSITSTVKQHLRHTSKSMI